MLLHNFIGVLLYVGSLQFFGELFLLGLLHCLFSAGFGDFRGVVSLVLFAFFLLFGSLFGQNRLPLCFLCGLSGLFLSAFLVGDCFGLRLERCLLSEDFLLLLCNERKLSVQVDGLLRGGGLWLDDGSWCGYSLSLHYGSLGYGCLGRLSDLIESYCGRGCLYYRLGLRLHHSRLGDW